VSGLFHGRSHVGHLLSSISFFNESRLFWNFLAAQKSQWHAQVPNLAFLGLPHSVVPFPLMEFQAEAVWEQWQNCTLLPDVEERLHKAMEDANSAGKANQGRRVVDTHYLGDAQWNYCREMAQFAGLLDEPLTTHDKTTTTKQASTEAYIRVNKALYDYVGRYRKSLLPGGPDVYRDLIFTRFPTQDKFEVMTIDPSSLTSLDGRNVDVISSNAAAATCSQHGPVHRTIITV
jgi:hypothetical protein